MRSIGATAEARTIGDATAAWLREAAIAVVGCGVAGVLVGGAGSRLAMRVVASTYTILPPWLPRAAIPRGVVFGSLLLALLGTVVIDPRTPTS